MTRSNHQVLRAIVLLLALALLASTLTGCNPFKRKTKEPIPIETLIPLTPEEVPPPVRLGDLSDTGESLPPLSPPERHGSLSIPQVEPVRAEATMVVSELQTVHFPYDSSRILPAEQAKLEQNAQWILSHPGMTIQIEGHCDERGSVEYNINLGQRRADAVREALYRLGVDPGMLTTISYGEERPLDPGHNEAAWQRNRRVQFLIY